MIFSGSYNAEDVHFLLTPDAQITTMSLAEKEQRIQSGQHYGCFLTPETQPTEAQIALFHTTLYETQQAIAMACARLAHYIALQYKNHSEIVLISLARAGTPFGIILKRLLSSLFLGKISHYSVSILREQGLDRAALATILQKGHAPEACCFIDGWTGKGGIAQTLYTSLDQLNTEYAVQIPLNLYALVDLAGVATYAPFQEDIFIPSCLLNATVSGLISRTVCPIGHHGWHQCAFYSDFADQDQSIFFVEAITQLAQGLLTYPFDFEIEQANHLQQKIHCAMTVTTTLAIYQTRYAVPQTGLIKIGLGESARALLRRVPEKIIIHDPNHVAVQALLSLARARDISIVFDRQLPYQMLTILKRAD